MNPAGVPSGAFKTQHLFYADGKQLVVYRHRRAIYIRDELGRLPFDLTYGCRHTHPEEGKDADLDYYELGLYYGLGMPGTGWGSEGEF